MIGLYRMAYMYLMSHRTVKGLASLEHVPHYWNWPLRKIHTKSCPRKARMSVQGRVSAISRIKVKIENNENT